MKLLGDEEIEDRLHLIAQADIGFDGRRLTKCRVKYETPCGWEEYYEPTPIEYAREIAKAQARLTHQEDVAWLESQFYGGQGRQRIFRIDCDELDTWKNEIPE